MAACVEAPTPGGNDSPAEAQPYLLRPTIFGTIYGATAVLVLIGAINYQLSLAYLFTFALIGLGHAALLQNYRKLLKLELRARRGTGVRR